MGAASFGAESAPGWSFLNAEETVQAVKLCKEYGVTEFDTAKRYCKGLSEVVLGNAIRDTFPSGSSPTPVAATKAHPIFGFTADEIEKQLSESLQGLKYDSVDIYYLHAPDTKANIEDSLAGIDRLYRAKKFKEFGLSNYHPFQVAQIYYICKAKGYVLPTVYQGIYNLLTRDAELELFLALKLFKIRFYAYSPLAGGLLMGKAKYDDKPAEGGRFTMPLYQTMFWKKGIFDEIEVLRKLGEEHKISMPEISFRWLIHHSALSEERGDAIILGASKLAHVKPNLELTKGGPLPSELVKEIENIWARLGKAGVNLEFRAVQPSSL